jgi:hypothetical protein
MIFRRILPLAVLGIVNHGYTPSQLLVWRHLTCTQKKTTRILTQNETSFEPKKNSTYHQIEKEEERKKVGWFGYCFTPTDTEAY